jgi:hypothetical protein
VLSDLDELALEEERPFGSAHRLREDFRLTAVHWVLAGRRACAVPESPIRSKVRFVFTLKTAGQQASAQLKEIIVEEGAPLGVVQERCLTREVRRAAAAGGARLRNTRSAPGGVDYPAFDGEVFFRSDLASDCR